MQRQSQPFRPDLLQTSCLLLLLLAGKTSSKDIGTHILFFGQNSTAEGQQSTCF